MGIGRSPDGVGAGVGQHLTGGQLNVAVTNHQIILPLGNHFPGSHCHHLCDGGDVHILGQYFPGNLLSVYIGHAGGAQQFSVPALHKQLLGAQGQGRIIAAAGVMGNMPGVGLLPGDHLVYCQHHAVKDGRILFMGQQIPGAHVQTQAGQQLAHGFTVGNRFHFLTVVGNRHGLRPVNGDGGVSLDGKAVVLLQ